MENQVIKELPIYPLFDESATVIDHQTAELIRQCYIRIFYEGEYWLSFYKCAVRYKIGLERAGAVALINNMMRRDVYVHQHCLVPNDFTFDSETHSVFVKDPDQTSERERVMKLVKDMKI
jgi:hypothetical protein